MPYQQSLFQESLPTTLDVTMGHRGMQRELFKTFGMRDSVLSVDIRPLMTNGMVPDIVADSRTLPFKKESFGKILFDPPFSFHGAKSCGGKEYNRFYITYGLNLYTTKKELGEYISDTFREIQRVLKPGGVCLLKWSESRIKLDFPLSFADRFSRGNIWERPSKYKGTKTGTSTWYIWLHKA